MKQITVRQYTELQPQKQLPYITLFTSLKEKALLKIKINELSYNEVRSIFKKLSTSAEIEDVKDIFVIALKIDELEFYELPLQNFFQIKKYISNYFVNLQRKETQLLQTIHSQFLKKTQRTNGWIATTPMRQFLVPQAKVIL